MPPTPRNDDFQIAIICALGIESEAVEGLFDHEFEANNVFWQKADGDRNSYTTGVIGKHNVVLAYMPGIGKVNAATTASSISATFHRIKLALVVGVCGGAPKDSKPDGEDIFLGDVIIGTQIWQGDFGRELVNGFVMKTTEEGNLGQPSLGIRSFLHKLQCRSVRRTLQARCSDYVKNLQTHLELEPPRMESDILFPIDYIHKHQISSEHSCDICSRDDSMFCVRSQKLSCTQLGCFSGHNQRGRTRNIALGPQIFFGSMLSSDAIKRNGFSRDEITAKHNVIAFEMEGAGVWDCLPTLVIKAVCDYADSHKNKNWQAYAAITAAACCKAVLEHWTPACENADGRESNDKDVKELSKKYLASLNFDHLNTRLHDIQFAQAGTCDWILNSAEFKSWLNEEHRDIHHGILWIKGKPGSGKSTMMKYIYQFVQERYTGKPIMAYFFHARGNDLQKNIIGLLRSLVLQLVQGNSRLLNHFIAAFPELDKPVETRKWAKEQLQHFLYLAIRQGWFEEAIILIDALDECDHNEARKLVKFCEDLAWNAKSKNRKLLICLSSRHYPHIGMKKCVELRLDDKTEHDADIREYIFRNIRISAPSFVELVVRKAKHVFLWAVLMVEILNESHDRGSGLKTMTEQVNSTPSDLHAIFDIKLRSGDGLDEATVLMFRLVLYAFAPLSPRTLYLLVKAGTDRKHPSTWVDGDMTDERIRKMILDSSRGVLEIVTDTNSWEGASEIVQFIHESVVDFMCTPTAGSELFCVSWICHRDIFMACVTVLLLEPVLSEALTNMSFEQVPYVDHITPKYSHLAYALVYTLRHISEASDSPDLIELVEQCMQALVPWIRLNVHDREVMGYCLSWYPEKQEGLLLPCIMMSKCWWEGNNTSIFDNRLLQLVLDHPRIKAVISSDSKSGLLNYTLHNALRHIFYRESSPSLLEAMELLIAANPNVVGKIESSKLILEKMANTIETGLYNGNIRSYISRLVTIMQTTREIYPLTMHWK